MNKDCLEWMLRIFFGIIKVVVLNLNATTFIITAFICIPFATVRIINFYLAYYLVRRAEGTEPPITDLL